MNISTAFFFGLTEVILARAQKDVREGRGEDAISLMADYGACLRKALAERDMVLGLNRRPPSDPSRN